MYRLYDDVKAAKVGQFWTVDEREGNASFQMDTATKYEWNKLTKKTNVHIPEGIFLYEGPNTCLLYTSPSPRDRQKSRMPSSA